MDQLKKEGNVGVLAHKRSDRSNQERSLCHFGEKEYGFAKRQKRNSQLTIAVFLSQKGPAKNRAFTLFFYVKTVIVA